jgi:acyl-CoA thioester hydrolase
MLDDFAYRHRMPVRFRDCDAMGHVNHAVYFTYLEQCRLTFWREVTGDASPHMRVIIARAECNYRAPARFGDELEVGMKVGDIGRSSFSLQYEITDVESGRLVATGQTVMVSYDYAASRPVPLPDVARALLERVRGTQQPSGSSGSDGGPDGGQTPV